MKPILFNTDMVKAILEGRKTVTRRIIKPQPEPDAKMAYTYAAGRKSDWGKWKDLQAGQQWAPPYHAGDILYVRETWTQLFYVDENGYTHFDQKITYYAADGWPDITLVDDDGFELDDQRIKWKPSIHMPKDLARIFLRVKSVRVERLQSITADECPMEGVWPLAACTVGERDDYYRSKFAELWDSTIKPSDLDTYGWATNPWVWVIKFERCEKPEEETL